MYKPMNCSIRDNKTALALAQSNGKLPMLIGNNRLPGERGYVYGEQTRRLSYSEIHSGQEGRIRFVRALVGKPTKEKTVCGTEYCYDKTIRLMFETKVEGNMLFFSQIPGVHDVQGHYKQDIFEAFVNILLTGFRGGAYCNVMFLGQDAKSRFSEFEYSAPLSRDKTSETGFSEIAGDRYRLVVWSGFTNNYQDKLRENPHGRKMPMLGEGTVGYAPKEHIEPYIILAKGLTKEQQIARIGLYTGYFDKLKSPLPEVLSRDDYKPVKIYQP